METTKIYGAPGTGKTTRLLKILEDEIRAGVPPQRIAYITHTVSARLEAIERVKKLLDVNEEKLQYFKTIHSICFKKINCSTHAVMGARDYMDFGKRVGVSFSKGFVSDIDLDGLPVGYSSSDGNMILNAYFFSRANLVDMLDVQNIWPRKYRPSIILEMIEEYKYYKLEEGKVDFPDMLEKYLKESSPLNVDVIIVDEAQDLSKLQWEVVTKFSESCDRLYLAGDDDQTIFSFIGADPDGFLKHPADDVEILPKTYRLKSDIWRFSKRIIEQIKDRQTKKISVKAEGGIVERTGVMKIDFEEETMIIARHNNQLREIAKRFDELGIPYKGIGIDFEKHIEALKIYLDMRAGNKVLYRSAAKVTDLMGKTSKSKEFREVAKSDPEAMVSLKDADLGIKSWIKDLASGASDVKKNMILQNIISRNGIEELDKEPKISLTTYHKSKGREANHVVLITDCYDKAWRSDQENSIEGIRLAYVGATRAKERLTIVNPTTDKFMRALCI